VGIYISNKETQTICALTVRSRLLWCQSFYIRKLNVFVVVNVFFFLVIIIVKLADLFLENVDECFWVVVV